MANTVIELRHSYVTGNVPASLANGEIAINTYDGKIFYRGGSSNTIQTIERYTGPAGLDGEIQFNDSGVLGSSANLKFNKTSGLFQTKNVTANVVTADSFITTGSYGNIQGANLIYANTFIANTGGYFQFADGSKQYTANAGSSSANSFGRIYASNNTTYANASIATDTINFIGESGIAVVANSTAKSITFAATPGAQGLTVDYGYVYEAINYSIDYGTI